MKLSYVIKYVAVMETGVMFFEKQLGLKKRFQSPGWTEFETGETTLALHQASEEHPHGTSQLGFAVSDIEGFYTNNHDNGIEFISAPTETFGRLIAKFKDSEGAECSLSGD
jgi:lactoylglutathione lyase